MIWNALPANERRSVDFSAVIGIRSVKSNGYDMPRPKTCGVSRRMFLDSGFTFPSAAGTSEASNGIKERAAAEHLAVVQHQNAVADTFHRVEPFNYHSKGSGIESVLNHDFRFSTDKISEPDGAFVFVPQAVIA
jgi:hypothetical protein